MAKMTKKQIQANMDQAWPKERLRALGPLQKELLPMFVGQDESQGKELTVQRLESALNLLEEYFPEELIPSSGMLERLRQFS